MLKTVAKPKTITRTFTFHKDIYDRFKKEVPDRKISAMLNEFMTAHLSRKAVFNSAQKKMSAAEAKRFKKYLAEINQADIKTIN